MVFEIFDAQDTPKVLHQPLCRRRRPIYEASNEPDLAIYFLQQLRAKVMIIDFHHMAQSLVETPVR